MVRGPHQKRNSPRSTVVDTDGEHQRQRRDYDIPALRKVHLIFDQISDAYTGNHTVENEGNTSHGRRRHYGNHSRHLRRKDRITAKMAASRITLGS